MRLEQTKVTLKQWLLVSPRLALLAELLVRPGVKKDSEGRPLLDKARSTEGQERLRDCWELYDTFLQGSGGEAAGAAVTGAGAPAPQLRQAAVAAAGGVRSKQQRWLEQENVGPAGRGRNRGTTAHGAARQQQRDHSTSSGNRGSSGGGRSGGGRSGGGSNGGGSSSSTSTAVRRAVERHNAAGLEQWDVVSRAGQAIVLQR